MRNIYDSLNDKQKQAVFCTKGPLLILAGAGSGKTRVLVHRIAYLIENEGVEPYNIMAITFTNKAAKEMRERVDSLIGQGSEHIWVSTFHSSCVKILRSFIDRLGYEKNFSIYDTDDQKAVIRTVIKRLNIDNKKFAEGGVLRIISKNKNELISPEEYENSVTDFYEKQVAKIYAEYQKELKINNALDFDDLIVFTVKLFEENPKVLDYWQERFKYIMVDEYQDTNTVQFRLIHLLADKYKNLCVVGDDDQSIYKFRGANISNILNFEKVFLDAKVIKLEQNYRSKGNILAAANSVIKNNKGRKEKKLWTEAEAGKKIVLRQFTDAKDEADFIISDIEKKAAKGDYNNYAVLYRTNAQSRLFEERCIFLSLPYQLIGGVNFYQRKEIKDILAYIKTVANGRDNYQFNRIINLPKRGIGDTSLNKLALYAQENGLSFYAAATLSANIESLGKAKEKFAKFVNLIEGCRFKVANGINIGTLINEIIKEIEYEAYLLSEGEEDAKERMANIAELVNKASEYEGEDINTFLEEIALVSDIDRTNPDSKALTLMTLHAAKGLEFDYVYMAGMDDGLFPSQLCITSEDLSELEEERRLCYVGITRAKKELILTSAKERLRFGQTNYYFMSRFVEEIDQDLLEKHIFDNKQRFVKKDADRSNDFLPWNKGFARKSVSGFSKSENRGIGFGKTFELKKAASLEYKIGDRVEHKKFGAGTVINIEDKPKDFEVSIEFDNFGTKKMFAGFAKLLKI